MYQYVIKRLIDFIVVFFVLIIIWPVLLLVTLWLHFANKGAGSVVTKDIPDRVLAVGNRCEIIKSI